MPHTRNNAFVLLGIAGNEVPVCRLLSALLIHPDLPPDALLAALLGTPLERPVARLSARTELSFAGARSGRRADLVVDWVDSAHASHQLLVEAKLYASEGPDQCADYRAAMGHWALEHHRALDSLGASDTDPTAARFTFLTLFGERAAVEGFTAVSFDALVPALKAYAQLSGAIGVLARDLADLIEQSSAAAHWTPEESYLAVLERCRDQPLDARFRAYRVLVLEVAQSARFPEPSTYRGAAQGRAWYGAHLARPQWFCEASWRRALDSFDPDCDWWVHLQPRLNFTADGHAHRLDLGFYLELAPYQSAAAFALSVKDAARRLAYERLRGDRVARMLEALTPLHWTARGNRNQAAAWLDPIPLDQPVSALIQQLAAGVTAASDAIDAALAGRWPAQRRNAT